MSHPLKVHRRVLLASLVGTAAEFYDFQIFSIAAALVIGPLFFPAESTFAQLMFSYMSFGLAFFARPMGAMVFGHFGDRMGRKPALVASLMLMGGSTLLIGVLPSFEAIGWAAPALLCVLRFAQGLGLGGEWGAAALLCVENAPKGWKARFGSAPQMGAPLAFVTASGLFLLLGLSLSETDFLTWGWRVPFLVSVVPLGLGLWVRLKISETPIFTEVTERRALSRAPLGELLRDHFRPTLAGTLAAVACFATFYLATVFALGYGTSTQGHDREGYLVAQLCAMPFLALGIILAAHFSDASSPARILKWGCAGTVGVGLLYGPLVGGASLLLVWLGLAIAMFGMGFVYGPLGAWLPNQFPVQVRYTGASVSFNVGGIIGGALAPLVAQWLSRKGGIEAVGLYLAAAGVLSWAGVMLGRRDVGAFSPG